MGYPDTEGLAYSFARAELSLGRKIFTAIGNVEIDQPTVEGAVMGTRAFPLRRTLGQMELGVGTVNFTDESERMDFLTTLGPAFREVKWELAWLLNSPGMPMVKIIAVSCRVLSNPIAHAQGEDALGGDIGFSFMYHTVNGQAPHSGLPSPSR